MRAQALTAVKAGITRLRDKGGASADSLYDLLNGYVTAARTIRCRPGTRIDVELPSGNKGLAWFRGRFVAFSHRVTDSLDPRSDIEVVRHPSDVDIAVKEVHFALPFLGYLYVVVEFEDGLVRHYWLEKGEPWVAGKVYLPGTLVRPTTDNGVAYRVESDRAGYTPWAPNVARAAGDVVVPTTDNGYRYVVNSVIGERPRSGTSEPDWPTNPGELVIEDVSTTEAYKVTDKQTSVADVPFAVADRYGTGNSSTSGGA